MILFYFIFFYERFRENPNYIMAFLEIPQFMEKKKILNNFLSLGLTVGQTKRHNIRVLN